MRKYSYLLPVIIICSVLGLVVARNLRRDNEHFFDSTIMMDTVVEISAWGRGAAETEEAAHAALAEMARVDSIFGNGIVDTRLSEGVLSTPEFDRLMQVSRDAHERTGRLFDPTIGSVSRLWEFWEGAAPPAADSVRSALASVGLDRFLAGGNSAILDLGGVAKGYAVDRAADRLGSRGIESAIVNAGGDLSLIGKRVDGKPWRIAIRHPRQQGAFLGYLDLENVSVATSGDYEKFFFFEGRRYHHILDPRTGLPGGGCASVTVVAPNTCLADALSTGLFLLGPGPGLRVVEGKEGVEAVFIYADGESVAVSSGLAERFGRFESE